MRVVGRLDVSVGSHIYVHSELAGGLAFESLLLNILHKAVEFLATVVRLKGNLQSLLVGVR